MKRRVRRKTTTENANFVKRFAPNIETGLTDNELRYRIEHEQTNKTHEEASKSILKIIFEHVFTFFNFLMFGIAALFIVFVGLSSIGNLSFIVIIIINILIGTIQEIKAKLTIKRLKLLNTSKVHVLREGKFLDVYPHELVLDDIVELKAGDQVPADCILLNGEVSVNESLLTGESDAIEKSLEKDKILFSGSFIISGSALCLLDKVGDNTYISSIEQKSKEFRKPKSKLMVSISGIIKKLTAVVIPIGLLTFWNTLIISNDLNRDVLSGAITSGGTAMVGMIPCGMMLLASIAMATGIVKLGKKNTLVKDLYSVESLSRVDTLCLDKTGTITDGTMSVDDVIYFEASTDYENIDRVLSIYLGSFNETNQTSDALIKKFGIIKTSPIRKLAFSSDRKYSAASLLHDEIYDSRARYRFNVGGTFVLGAPEYLTTDKVILSRVKQYAITGKRCLLFARCKGGISDDGEISKRRVPLMLIVISDTVRPEVKKTLKWFSENDVDIKVISGDNIDTVKTISQRAGVPHWENAVDLSTVPESEFENAVMSNSVFGRVTPEQKAQIVDILHEHGRTVSLTGDGVNDILAMKKADCSIAMANGSPATKSVANVVLMDSNFDNMPATVMEGRRVVNNIQRSSTLFLMKDFFVMFLSLFCILIGVKFPIQTSVIGIVNILITGISSFLLSIEPSYARIEGSFNKNVFGKAIPAGLYMAIPCIFLIIQGLVVNNLNISATNDYLATKVPIMALFITIAGFVIFFKVCRPFNKFRALLYGVMLGIAAFLLCAFPEFFLNNSTTFWGELLSNYQGSAIIEEVINRLFTFKLYSTFSLSDWILILIYLVFSFVFYTIADILTTRILKIKMFNVALYDDEDE